MQSRSTLVLVSLVTLVILLVAGWRAFQMTDETSPAVTRSSAVTTQVSAAPAPAVAHESPAVPIATRPSAPISPELGSADGNIDFVRKSDGAEGPAAAIRLRIASAVGLWKPDESRMRILLLEVAPDSDALAAILDALRAGGALPSTLARHATIELTFSSTAQAFDRNDLETATLVARDGAASSTADALPGLSWTGSLPSPQVSPPAGYDFPSVELVSSGNSDASDPPGWHQSWKVAVNVPIVMRVAAAGP